MTKKNPPTVSPPTAAATEREQVEHETRAGAASGRFRARGRRR